MGGELIILGTGGSAYDVLDIVEALNARQRTWEVVGFLDDARLPGSEHLGVPVLGGIAQALRFAGKSFINVIGSDKSYLKREEIIASTGLPMERFATLVHPLAAVSTRARLGRGVYVNAGVSVGGAVRIGDQVSLGPGSIVGHDTVIGEYSMLAPGAIVSGFVGIGRSCYVGAGSVIKHRLKVGDGALVGMGAVVTRDVEAGVTVVGCPARPINSGQPAMVEKAATW